MHNYIEVVPEPVPLGGSCPSFVPPGRCGTPAQFS